MARLFYNLIFRNIFFKCFYLITLGQVRLGYIWNWVKNGKVSLLDRYFVGKHLNMAKFINHIQKIDIKNFYVFRFSFKHFILKATKISIPHKIIRRPRHKFKLPFYKKNQRLFSHVWTQNSKKKDCYLRCEVDNFRMIKKNIQQAFIFFIFSHVIM